VEQDLPLQGGEVFESSVPLDKPELAETVLEVNTHSASPGPLLTERRMPTLPMSQTDALYAQGDYAFYAKISQTSKLPMSLRLDVHAEQAVALATMRGGPPEIASRNASWLLQWHTSRDTYASSPDKSLEEDRGIALAQQSCGAFWRLLWSQHAEVASKSAEPSQMPLAKEGPCMRVAFSANAWRDFMASQLSADAPQSVHFAHSTTQPYAASPFGPCLTAASLACEEVIGSYSAAQSNSLFPAIAPWQLSWANQSRSHSFVQHFFQNMVEAAGTDLEEQPVALWRLPWAGNLSSEIEELEPFKDYVKVLRGQEMLHPKANWQLVWMHSP